MANSSETQSQAQSSETVKVNFLSLFFANSIIKTIIIVGLLIIIFTLNYQWTRMIHIIAGFVWYAMLIFLVVIFLPLIHELSKETVYDLIGNIVPRIFHTVTISGFFAVGVGWYNAYLLSGGRIYYFIGYPKAILFTISIIVVTGMYLFHVFLESSELNVSSAVSRGEIAIDSKEYQQLLKGLTITPRVGFLIITFAIIMMFIH